MNYRSSAKEVSLGCDTVSSNKESTDMPMSSVNVIEIPTTVSRSRAVRMSGRFLKGPIPMPSIAQASSLGGRALAVYLAVHHQTTLTGKLVVSLPRGLLADLGIDKDAKTRALRALEAAGLVIVERIKGRAAKVALGNRAT